MLRTASWRLPLVEGAVAAVPNPGRRCTSEECGRAPVELTSQRVVGPSPGPAPATTPRGRSTLADPDTINVLIVDDDPLVREGLRMLLALDRSLLVVGEAATCAEALRQTQFRHPDVVLLDLELTADRGFALLGELRRRRLLA